MLKKKNESQHRIIIHFSFMEFTSMRKCLSESADDGGRLDKVRTSASGLASLDEYSAPRNPTSRFLHHCDYFNPLDLLRHFDCFNRFDSSEHLDHLKTCSKCLIFNILRVQDKCSVFKSRSVFRAPIESTSTPHHRENATPWWKRAGREVQQADSRRSVSGSISQTSLKPPLR